MIMQLAAKIAGPRVLIGVIVAALVAVGTLLWLYAAAREHAGALDAQLDRVSDIAEQNAAEAERLRQDIAKRERLAEKHREQLHEIQERYSDIRTRLQQAGAAADGPYRDCRDARLPTGVIDGLQDGARSADGQD